MSVHPPLVQLTTFADLDEILRFTCAEEAQLRGIPEWQVREERKGWLSGSKSAASFLRMWRNLHGLDVTSYCRLNGSNPADVRRTIREPGFCKVLEPITWKALVPLWMPLSEGYTYDEIQRARGGEHIHLMRALRARAP